MNWLKSTKRIVLLVSVAAILGSAGIYAYFSAPGNGTGTASVGTASDIVLSSEAVGGLYPDGPDVAVTVGIENPGSGSQHVGTISGAVQGDGDCLAAWFEVDSVTYDSMLAAGGTDSATTAIRMLDNGENQDACQGKTLTVDWSSN